MRPKTTCEKVRLFGVSLTAVPMHDQLFLEPVRNIMSILRECRLIFILFGCNDFDGEWRGWNRVILLVNLKRQRDLACGGGCGRLGVGHDLDDEAG